MGAGYNAPRLARQLFLGNVCSDSIDENDHADGVRFSGGALSEERLAFPEALEGFTLLHRTHIVQVAPDRVWDWVESYGRDLVDERQTHRR